jgi:hypothetical protein
MHFMWLKKTAGLSMEQTLLGNRSMDTELINGYRINNNTQHVPVDTMIQGNFIQFDIRAT